MNLCIFLFYVRGLYMLFMYIDVWSHLHHTFPSVDIKGVIVSGQWKQKVYGQSNKIKSRLRWPAPLPYWLRRLRLRPLISWFNLTNKPRYFRLNPANWLNFVTRSTSQCLKTPVKCITSSSSKCWTVSFITLMTCTFTNKWRNCFLINCTVALKCKLKKDNTTYYYQYACNQNNKPKTAIDEKQNKIVRHKTGWNNNKAEQMLKIQPHIMNN